MHPGRLSDTPWAELHELTVTDGLVTARLSACDETSLPHIVSAAEQMVHAALATDTGEDKPEMLTVALGCEASARIGGPVRLCATPHITGGDFAAYDIVARDGDGNIAATGFVHVELAAPDATRAGRWWGRLVSGQR